MSSSPTDQASRTDEPEPVPGSGTEGTEETEAPDTDVAGAEVRDADVAETEERSAGSPDIDTPVAETIGVVDLDTAATETESPDRTGEPGADRFRLVIVTGMSGAGRSTAANALEDLGWYVVDNLPPSVLLEVCELARQARQTRLAVVLDVRTRSFFEQLPTMFSDLNEAGIQPEIVYLEAGDDVIVRRQESARRPHPLQGDGRLMDGITAERASLATLRAAADLVIDTSSLNVHQLGTRINHAFGTENHDQLRVTVISFGFKNGIPIDADLVFDVRFLPNPHWIPALRPLTGLSREVSTYVLEQQGAEEFIEQLQGMLRVIGAGYVREGKRFATVAIGCTGGKHRSTAIAEEFARRLRETGTVTNVLHRDLGRE